MVKQVYLYTDPFVQNLTIGEIPDYILENFTDSDREDQEKIHAVMLQFAVNNGLIENVDNTLAVRPEENMGSWRWMMTWLNFRSLVDSKRYGSLTSALSGGDGNPVDMIIDLHARLGVLFDHRLLNTLAHRTITSISLIPYAVPEDSDRVEWDVIHKEAPFMWVLIYLQTVISSTAKPIQ